MKRFLAAIIAVLLFNCNGEKGEKCAVVPEIKNPVELDFRSMEDSLPSISNKQQLVDFFTRHPEARDILFNRPAYPGDSTFINRLYNRFSNPHIDTLVMSTHSVFGSGDELRAQFQLAFSNLKHYFPESNPPRIETYVTGMDTDLFVSDSLVMIGLDYFLGSGAKYRPDMYDYMLRRYNKDFIVPSVMLLTGIDTHYNKTNLGDRTVLADMIAYGKAYYFTKQMLPCTPDSVLIGYTAKEMEGSRKFENLIWSRLVEDQVLFSTSHLVKQKYIAERPKTLEVGEDCPGRIATWIGWQIVKKYMESHPDISLKQLMEMPNAAQLFKESGYKPQVVSVPGRDSGI